MIRKSTEMESETRENMRGGGGSVTIQHCFNKDEIKAKSRLCARLIIPAGAGIGLHEHQEEDEVFIITRGKGLVDEGDGAEKPVETGDAILTGDGSAHAIRNNGDEDLEVVAVIMEY